jgi:peptidoglycan hydrolase-like protein with peptidoglycan-binding domain
MTAKQVQNLLQYLGFYDGIPDGVWGPLSQRACREFQSRFGGIAVDGFAGKETEMALKHAVSLGYLDKEGTPTDPAETGTFWDGIKYWTREEFRCQCGGKYCDGFPAEPDQTLVELVDDLREAAGRPGHRSSGLRCKTWNAIQGGVANSRHMTGKALDFYIEGVSGSKLLSMAQADPRTRYAYIIEGQYVHVDVN